MEANSTLQPQELKAIDEIRKLVVKLYHHSQHKPSCKMARYKSWKQRELRYVRESESKNRGLLWLTKRIIHANQINDCNCGLQQIFIDIMNKIHTQQQLTHTKLTR